MARKIIKVRASTIRSRIDSMRFKLCAFSARQSRNLSNETKLLSWRNRAQQNNPWSWPYSAPCSTRGRSHGWTNKISPKYPWQTWAISTLLATQWSSTDRKVRLIATQLHLSWTQTWESSMKFLNSTRSKSRSIMRISRTLQKISLQSLPFWEMKT